MKRPISVGCCVLDDSVDPPECTSLDGADSLTTLMGTESCNLTAGTCNVTIEVTLGDNTTSSELAVPICGDAPAPCISSDCIAQVCGSLTYNPIPAPSYRDAAKFEEEAEDTGQVSAAEEAEERTPTGLYGASCTLQRSDESLTNYLRNAKGSFINTFRFGVGDSFEEFDHYRWMFPNTDLYCNANPLAGTKDRYMNYLLSPDEFEDKMDGLGYDDPVERVTSAGFCLEDEVTPFLGETYDGADYPDYRYFPMERTSSGGSFEQTELDREFYSSFLGLIYREELEEGLSTFATLPDPAPFECSTSLECSSSYCDMQNYNRMLCKDTSTGNWVQCGCDERARRCNGQKTEFSYLNDTAPENAADLLEHLEGYNQGERYYAIYQLPVGIVDISVNPTCTASNRITGIDWIKVQARTPTNIMKYVDEGEVDPTPEELDDLEECEDDEDWEPCWDLVDRLLDEMDGDVILKGEVVETDKYPNDIIFFGESKQVKAIEALYGEDIIYGNFIGYSLLSEPRFRQSDFYRACRPSYIVVNATDTYRSGGRATPRDSMNPQTKGDYENDDAIDAVREAKVFIAPDPIPDYIGTGWKPYDTRIKCYTDNDDEGHYRYVPRYILISDTGVCEAEPLTHVPKTVAFGWCEPCSYSTLAKQTVSTKHNEYTPYQKITYSSYSKTGAESEYICDTQAPMVPPEDADPDSEAPEADLYCPTADETENPYGAYNEDSFNGIPDSIYLQEKQSQYLKENIMPIFDMTDATNWDYMGNISLKYTLIDRGPSILIVQNISAHETIPESILERVESAKLACPSCLIAVRFSNNGTPFSINATQRLEENLELADDLDPETTPGLLENLDMVMISFYPNEYTDEFPEACEQDLNEDIFFFLENQSRAIVNRTMIPVMVTEFGMETDSCWDETKTGQLLSHLFIKQKRLSRTGMAGIIFSNVSILTEEAGDHLPMFCALEKGSQNMVADEPATLFSRAYASPAEQVLCTACSDFDIVTGACGTTCINGIECTASPEAIDMAKTQLGLPAETPDSEVPLKCSDQMIPEPCTPCSEMSGQLYCEFFRSDGSVLNATYDIADLTVLEGDVISSIPPPYACCLEEEGGNYTFVKHTGMGKITAPLIYSPSGDPRQDCGIADVSALEQPLCDVPLPIKNHRVECTIIP